MPEVESATATTPTGLSAEDEALLVRLRAGHEDAFVELVDRYHAQMVRLALSFVSSHSVAEEVAQEAWLGVLKGLDHFEGRSSLKTWIFRILTNTAKTRGQRESRIVPFASLGGTDGDGEDAEFDLERFHPPGDALAGHWMSPPGEWETSPEDLMLSGEVRAQIEGAMAKLGPSQREVMRLRDIEGWSSEEVCNVLELTETNQRVLLHRARTKVRQALAQYFAGR